MPGLYQHLPPLDLVPVDAPQQNTPTASPASELSRSLVEHLQAGGHGLADLAVADDLNLVAHWFTATPLDPAR